jgi:hypothetical protein
MMLLCVQHRIPSEAATTCIVPAEVLPAGSPPTCDLSDVLRHCCCCYYCRVLPRCPPLLPFAASVVLPLSRALLPSCRVLEESRAKVTELHQAKRLANIDTGDAGDAGEGGDGKAKSKKRKKGAAAAAADEEFYVGDDAPIERVPKKKNVEVSGVVLGVGMRWSVKNVCMAGTARCDDQLTLHVVTRIQRD